MGRADWGGPTFFHSLFPFVVIHIESPLLLTRPARACGWRTKIEERGRACLSRERGGWSASHLTRARARGNPRPRPGPSPSGKRRAPRVCVWMRGAIVIHRLTRWRAAKGLIHPPMILPAPLSTQQRNGGSEEERREGAEEKKKMAVLPAGCSTFVEDGDGICTRDPQRRKLALCLLSLHIRREKLVRQKRER